MSHTVFPISPSGTEGRSVEVGVPGAGLDKTWLASSEMCAAVVAPGGTSKVARLLKAGQSAHSIDTTGMPLLALSLQTGQDATALELLRAGADPTADRAKLALPHARRRKSMTKSLPAVHVMDVALGVYHQPPASYHHPPGRLILRLRTRSVINLRLILRLRIFNLRIVVHFPYRSDVSSRGS